MHRANLTLLSFMFLSPLGERLGEGVQREHSLLQHPLTQPLPQGGEEHEDGVPHP
jgi:hypothetical protein